MGVRQAVARFFELPEDVLLDLPRITWVGDLQLILQNHRGILEYREGRITLSTTKGPLRVTGTELMVGAVDRETIIITGRIRGCGFVRTK